jgi:hypothetical protein
MFRTICLIIFSSNLISCASQPGLKILEERSDYLSDLKVLDLGYGTQASLPRRRGELALVWRHETQLPSGDYFWGGWVSIAVTRHSLVIEKQKSEK